MAADPKLDLVLERVVDLKPEVIWKAWTTPELLRQWFTPAPWKTVQASLELRPGGDFSTTMESPDGTQYPGSGCILEVIPNRKLVWTSNLKKDFRPVEKAENGADMAMTAVITLEPHGSGTKYTATALHANEASAKRHKEMGFHQGWGAALDQLVDLMRNS